MTGTRSPRAPSIPIGYALTRDERGLLFARFGASTSEGARALGVGASTYATLLDPHGRVSQLTIDKIRDKLKELTNEKNTG
jgi:hypothetical protein